MANTITKNQKTEIRRMVIEAMQEIFDNPDYGLPLTLYTIRRLKKSMKSKKHPKRLIPFEEIKEKYQ